MLIFSLFVNNFLCVLCKKKNRKIKKPTLIMNHRNENDNMCTVNELNRKRKKKDFVVRRDKQSFKPESCYKFQFSYRDVSEWILRSVEERCSVYWAERASKRELIVSMMRKPNDRYTIHLYYVYKYTHTHTHKMYTLMKICVLTVIIIAQSKCQSYVNLSKRCFNWNWNSFLPIRKIRKMFRPINEN